MSLSTYESNDSIAMMPISDVFAVHMLAYLQVLCSQPHSEQHELASDSEVLHAFAGHAHMHRSLIAEARTFRSEVN